MSEHPPDPTPAADADDTGLPETPRRDETAADAAGEAVATDDTRGQYSEGNYGAAGEVPEVPAEGSDGEYTTTEPEPESDAAGEAVATDDTVSTDDTRGQYPEGDYGAAGEVPEVPAEGREGKYTTTEPEPESDAE